MKIGFLSDLHVTHNMKDYKRVVYYIRSAVIKERIDILFLAGDTSSDSQITLDILSLLNQTGVETYGIFGNHEYLTISYDEAQEINSKSYANGKTIEVGNTSIVCIDGFFDYSFITEVDNKYTKSLPSSKQEINKISRILKDPGKNIVGNYSEVFEDMERKLASELKKAQGREIVMMLHYVPHSDFLLYKEDVDWTANNARMGSLRYHELAKEYGVSKVIFGHTHYTFNREIEGIEYYCNPVGYSGRDFQGSLEERISEQIRVFDV